MIDLRSDTLTLPSEKMLSAIQSASLGDEGRQDANGRGEDPTTRELEDLACTLTGKESALLFSSGTLANHAALMTHCKRGDKIAVDENMHIYRSEKAVFMEQFGGMTPVFYQFNHAFTIDIDSVEKLITEHNLGLICMENTHNFLGGICISPKTMAKVSDRAKEKNIPVHLDGARLFNACTQLNVQAKELCRYTDSVMFCISKGLGAPIGSLLCGSKEFIDRAREVKKLLGGNMRQSGIISAPGIIALKRNIKRLEEDHNAAKVICRGIADTKNIKIEQESVQTNIIIIDIQATGLTGNEFTTAIAKKGILLNAIDDQTVRMVTHNRTTQEDAVNTIQIFNSFVGSLQ
jgi:threonine aldolase